MFPGRRLVVATKHQKETDMRSMYNPTRMRIIAQTTEKLIAHIKSECPVCGTPGFTITDAREGLPCSLCGLPTRSTLNYDHICSRCVLHRSVKFPRGKTEEDPKYCDHCNPLRFYNDWLFAAKKKAPTQSNGFYAH